MIAERGVVVCRESRGEDVSIDKGGATVGGIRGPGLDRRFEARVELRTPFFTAKKKIRLELVTA